MSNKHNTANNAVMSDYGLGEGMEGSGLTEPHKGSKDARCFIHPLPIPNHSQSQPPNTLPGMLSRQPHPGLCGSARDEDPRSFTAKPPFVARERSAV